MQPAPKQPENSPSGDQSGRDAVPLVSTGFRRLAWSTLLLTFCLVIIGGIVRVSDSGLGCGPAGSGLEGWPLCHGRLVPGFDIHHIIEYTHRLVAGTLGILAIALTVWAFKRYREFAAVKWLASATLGLVIFAGSLGGLTVENDLHETLVAAHLGTAMAILAVILALALVSSGFSGFGAWPGRVRKLAIAASAGVWATIVAGGYMAGTQNYGRASYESGDGAHLACGKEFPMCNGDFLPFGKSELVNIHLVHRVFIYITVVLVIALAVQVLRATTASPNLADGAERVRPLAWTALGVLTLQVLLGALNVWLGEHPGLIAAHLTVGALLWLVLVSLTLSVTGRPNVPQGGTPGIAAGE